MRRWCDVERADGAGGTGASGTADGMIGAEDRGASGQEYNRRGSLVLGFRKVQGIPSRENIIIYRRCGLII